MDPDAGLPTGTVTFLFTDVEGSTRLWEEHPDTMGQALSRHDAILRDAVTSNGGTVVKTTGDGLHAVFTSARAAVDAAVDAQRALQAAEWGPTGPLHVRMGLNSGEAERRAGDYYGPAVNRAARIMAAAHGGQILASQTTAQLLEDGLPPGVTLVDLGEHRLRDLARPEHVYQVQARELRSSFPQLRSLDAYPTNLPAQRTSFVGRESDVDEVARALRERRVVTITGVGGVGKSRLAVQVAATILPRFPDGAWLCELASVTDEGAVADAVAEAVGVPAGSGPLRDALPQYLRNRRALLVIDNCEHVLGAVVELVDTLLARCPDVRVLATSRELLGLPGEQVFALGTLDAPADDDVGAVLASPAGRLFVERAREARHDFVLDEHNAAAVAKLCAHLDGIPLAIELAAARVRSLSPDQILDRLDERFRLLAGGAKARGRHQTLRGALAWSTDLLDDVEKSAFARLSVFVVAFDLPAAEAVIGDDAWEHIDALVDKSLLLSEPIDGTMRFRMLETVREFASEMLVALGEVADARDRHAAYYVEMCATLGASGGYEDAIAVRRDIRNVAAALLWLVAEEDIDRALLLASAFENMYLFAELGVGRAIERALSIPGALDHPLAPRLLAAAASFAISAGGDHSEAYARAVTSLELAADLGVDVPAPHHVNVASTFMRSGHLDDARNHVLTAIGQSRGDPLAETRAYVLLAAIEQWRHDLAAARAAADAAEKAARRADAPFDLAYAHLLQGYVHEADDPVASLSIYEEAARIALERLPTAVSVAAYSLASCARVRAQLGDVEGMVPDLERAVRLTATQVSREGFGIVLADAGIALYRIGRIAEAATVFSVASQVFEMRSLATTFDLEPSHMQARLTEAIGAEALSRAWERGASMSDRDVRTFILDVLADVRATLATP